MAISEIRNKRKLTQKQLAAAVGVSVPTVRNWEKGREGGRMFDVVARLCKVLNCEPEDLIGGDDE